MSKRVNRKRWLGQSTNGIKLKDICEDHTEKWLNSYEKETKNSILKKH